MDITFKTKQNKLKQVRIIPRKHYYILEAIYERSVNPQDLDPNSYATIDLGLNNLATITSNQPGFQPFLINGRPLKSINQFYNKRVAQLKSKSKNRTTKRISRASLKRECKIKNYSHKASRKIINILIRNKIGNLVIGYNPEWKQEINLGKINNQNFVNIPFYKFMNMLKYKAELVGIQVIINEESYTSKCSFLDNEPIEKRLVYKGRRYSRTFITASGLRIHADVNGSYNILRKAVPAAFQSQGIEAVVVRPITCKLSY